MKNRYKKIESKFEKLLDKETNQIKVEISLLTNHISKLQDENEDLGNRFMRSPLIFRGIPEDEQNDFGEKVTKYLTDTLAKKHQKVKIIQDADKYLWNSLTGAMVMISEDG